MFIIPVLAILGHMSDREKFGQSINLVAKIAVVRDGKVLLLRRSKTAPTRALEWDFPGGVVEPGEDPKKAVVRETYEETALELSEVSILDLHFLPSEQFDGNVLILLFKTEVANGAVELSYEHDQYEWIDYNAAKDYKMPDRYHIAIGLIANN